MTSIYVANVMRKYQTTHVLKQIADLATAELHQLEEAAKRSDDNKLAALRSSWKKENGRLSPAGVRERERCQKAGMSSRKIAKMEIDESAARYVPRRMS